MDFKNVRVLVCLGTGGVGKTTVAATLGYIAATQGLKTLVMTIDPSKRLAQTLGIEGKEGIVRVDLGKKDFVLDATVINHQRIFDEFLQRSISRKELADKILKNKLYQQLSTTLSGSQEFTSLEMLFQNYKSGKYDLIILDTPPASHAIEFLQAPQNLAELFQKETIQWFTQSAEGSTPFFKKVFQTGTQKVLSLLESITGSEFIGNLKDFFRNLGPWGSEILARTQQFHELLVSENTHFYLVTAPDYVSLKEAGILAKEIYRGGYRLEKIIFNRAEPPWDKPLQELLEADSKLHQDLKKQYKTYAEYFRLRKENVKEFLNHLPRRTKGQLLPEFEKDISNVETLKEFAEVFENENLD